MKYQKLPYKSYTIINNSAADNLNCPDLYRFFVLSLTTDKVTRTTNTTLEQLALFVGESQLNYEKGKSSTSFTDRLKESGEVMLEYYRDHSLKGDKQVNRIRYTFNAPEPTKYRRITKEFTEIGLPIKVKGYLLKLFILCDAHSFDLPHSKTKIAQLLSMDKRTVDGYNKILIEAGYLVPVSKHFQLNVSSFLLDQPNKISKRAQEVIDSFNSNLDYKTKNNMQLSRSEVIFLKAKKEDFKDIINFDRWTLWLLSGLPNLKKKQQIDNIYLRWDLDKQDYEARELYDIIL